MKKVLVLTIAIVIIAFLIRNSEVCHPAAVVIPVMAFFTALTAVSIVTSVNQHQQSMGPPPSTPNIPQYILTCPGDRVYEATRGRDSAYTEAAFATATYGEPHTGDPKQVQGPTLGGKLSDGVYKIVFRGTDIEGGVHECSFTVTVMVTRCSGNLTAPKDGEMDCDPPGNIYGTQCNFRCSKQGYALVIPGEDRDVLTARTECTKNGTWSNAASPVCVQRCPDIPPPDNGYVSCTGANKIICRTYCDSGYDNAMFYQNDRGFYWCSTDDGIWKPSLNIPPCTKVPDEFLGIFQTSTFNVSCNDNSSLAKLKENMISEMPSFLKDQYKDVVANYSVRINCSQNNRNKRSLQRLTSHHERVDRRSVENADQGLAQVTIEITVKRKPTESAFQRRQTLYGIFSAINNVGEAAANKVGVTRVSRGKYGINMACDEGTIKSDINLACIECPQGTYHNTTEDVCALCPLGAFQNKAGQTACHTCPDGKITLETGSRRPEDCVQRRVWGTWVAWDACSVTCVGGLRRRSRPCVADNEHCPSAKQVQTETCNTEDCRVCAPLLVPNNSTLQCKEESGVTICSLTCADGYGFSSPVLDNYTCGPLTGFLWSHQNIDNPNGTLPNCVQLKDNDLQFYLQTEFPLPRPITCNSTKYSEASGQIKDHFETIVGSAICLQAQLCEFQPPSILECITSPENATSTLTVGSHGKYLGTNVKSREAKQVYDEMVKLGQDLKTKVQNGEVGIIFDGEFIAPNISTIQATGGRGCPVGSIFTPDFSACVECQSGTYYIDPKRCFMCNIGYYQPAQGQLDCIKCPNETSTKIRGAVSISDCVSIKECPDPGVPIHGQRSGSRFSAGRTVYFMCDDGYRMIGDSSLHCLDDGVWDGISPKCARGVSLSCDFEDDDLCDFSQEDTGDNVDWMRKTINDFDSANDGTPIIYHPLSPPRGRTFLHLGHSEHEQSAMLSATLKSLVIETGSTQCLEFSFTAGSNTECSKTQKSQPSLNIMIQDWVSKNQVSIWKFNASTFIGWKRIVVPIIHSFDAYQILIEGTTPNDEQMFLAVDDVIIRACTADDDTSGTVGYQSSDVISSCNFDQSFCTWRSSRFWKISSPNPPVSPMQKTYAGLSNQETQSTFISSNLVSQNFDGDESLRCVRFNYTVHAFSRLTLLVRSASGPHSHWSTNIWSDCILGMGGRSGDKREAFGLRTNPSSWCFLAFCLTGTQDCTRSDWMT